MPGYSDELARAKAIAAELARQTRDAVTGLAGRGAFDEELNRCIRESTQSNNPIVLVMADVDHFKKVNDKHGHQRGDAVLRGVGALLEAVIRSQGSAYRYGGEEFGLILPNHVLAEGLAVAEKTRRLVEAQQIEKLSMTLSLGVAAYPLHAMHATGLVGAADEAMYDAKSKGRNLVRVFGEPTPPLPQSEPQVERKLPELDHVRDEDRAEYRRAVARGEVVMCPRDGAPFDIEDVTPIRSIGRDFWLTCPVCGLAIDTRGVDR